MRSRFCCQVSERNRRSWRSFEMRESLLPESVVKTGDCVVSVVVIRCSTGVTPSIVYVIFYVKKCGVTAEMFRVGATKGNLKNF